MKSFRIALIGAMALMSSSAFAGVRFGLHYMPTYTLPLGSTQTAGLGLAGGGASFGALFGAKQMFGLEVQGGYVSHMINSTNLATIQAQVGPMVWFNNYIGIKAFGSFNYGLSLPAAYNASPYWVGAGGGIDFNLPIGNSLAFTLGGQFTYNFMDIAAAGTTINPAVIMAQAGLRFGNVRSK